MTRCRRCGRQLTDASSVARGVGPECLAKDVVTRRQVAYELAERDEWAGERVVRKLEAGKRPTPRDWRMVEAKARRLGVVPS